MLESKKTLAKEIMKTDVVTVSPSATVQEVARQMLEHDISGFPVVDEQKKVLGVVTELDLMRNQIAPNEPSIWRRSGAWMRKGRKSIGTRSGNIWQKRQGKL